VGPRLTLIKSMHRGKFNPRSPWHCSVLLFVLSAFYCGSAELAARYAFPRVSRVRGRIEAERNAARKLARAGDRPAVLFVGNSLFERGIDVPQLRQDLPNYNVARFVVSDTSYFDWYYGLQRLFSEGSRPQIVVVGLSTRNLVLQRIEGDLSANLLIRTADVNRVGDRLRKDNTAVSNLYFSNLSAFYGDRTQFRKWLLTTIMPDVESLGSSFRPKPVPDLAPPQLLEVAQQRLQAMQKVCADNGATLVLVIPPTLNREEDAIAAVQEAGKRAGVPVLSPIHPGELGPEYFRDGVHLTDAGAVRFTSSLSSDLLHSLPDSFRASLY